MFVSISHFLFRFSLCTAKEEKTARAIRANRFCQSPNFSGRSYAYEMNKWNNTTSRLTAVELITVIAAIVVAVTPIVLRNAQAVVTCEFVVTARTCATQSTTAPTVCVIFRQCAQGSRSCVSCLRTKQRRRIRIIKSAYERNDYEAYCSRVRHQRQLQST